MPPPSPPTTCQRGTGTGTGLRLDQLLMRRLGLSRRQARLAIAAGRVRAGGRPARIVARAYAPDALLELAAGPPQENQMPAPPALSVLAMRPLWVAVDKPAGLLAERDRSASPAVESLLPRWLAARGERPEVWLVHRLDAATSGVMVLARRPRAARHFGALFAARGAEKVYVALVSGHLAGEQLVDAPIGRVAGTRHGVIAGGRPARTMVLPLAWGPTATWVELRPQSGRTHQLRVHLAHLGHPIVGDRLYGGMMWTPQQRPVGRLMLHARLLGLPSPDEPDVAVRVASPVPAALIAARRDLAVVSPEALSGSRR